MEKDYDEQGLDQFTDLNLSDKNYEYLKEILYLIFNYPHKHYTFKHFEV